MTEAHFGVIATLYVLGLLAVVPVVGFLVTGGNWRAALRYTGEWMAVVGAIAAFGGLLAIIFA